MIDMESIFEHDNFNTDPTLLRGLEFVWEYWPEGGEDLTVEVMFMHEEEAFESNPGWLTDLVLECVAEFEREHSLDMTIDPDASECMMMINVPNADFDDSESLPLYLHNLASLIKERVADAIRDGLEEEG